MQDEGMLLVSGHENAELIDARMNDITTFRIVHDAERATFVAAAAGYQIREDGVEGERFAHPVVEGAVHYARSLLQVWSGTGRRIRSANPILFQCNDTPVDLPSVGWEARHGWKYLRLVPDLYYFREGGYENFRPELPAWRDRVDRIGWRGTSTGIPGLSLESLDRLPRYRLAKLAADLGDVADIGLSSVAQASDDDEHRRLVDRLTAEGLLREYVPFEQFGRFRYIVDIDGNANAWNFMQKLRLGACMLKVRSDWKQWFEDRLIAWRHYVPVKPDLSDFREKVDWCRRHPDLAEEIAREGRKFALAMRYDDEMERAADAVFGAT